jgi:ribosome-associated toxin RatA of RatAB toxin-antitoxin module
MPTVETTCLIDAPLDRVYEIAKDSRSFPEFMKDVKSVTPIESEENRFVSDWVGVVPTFGLKIRWRQEDLWDDAKHECRFRQISGDYDKLEGVWTFAEENGGTRFNQTVDYEYNVPTLGPLIKKVIHSIVQKNLDGINEAFAERARLA